MFWQRKNETRASRACKVGHLGLEQLDARVVPSGFASVTSNVSVALYSPSKPQKPDVAFDENGNIHGGNEVQWKKLSDEAQHALWVKDINQKYVYKLNDAIDLKYKGGDVWVKVTEPQKNDYNSKDSHGNGGNISDVLHIVTVQEKVDGKYGYGKPKYKDVTYVSVFSDKDEKSYGNDHKKDEKSDFDVGIPKVKYFDIKTDEQGPEDNNYATFDVNHGKKNEVDFFFQSDGKLRDKY